MLSESVDTKKAQGESWVSWRSPRRDEVMGRKHLTRMIAKKVPRLVEIFHSQWTSGILPIAKKMIVPGPCLNYNQTPGPSKTMF